MTEVLLVLKRDAKTDPPPAFSDLVWTDQGPARYGWDRHAAWQDHEGCELDPSWWYELRPTEREPLTVEHLHLAVLGLGGEGSWLAQLDDEPAIAAARLREALDALTREGST